MYLDDDAEYLLKEALDHLELIDTSVFADSLQSIEAVRNLGIAQGILQSFLARADTSKVVENKE